MSDETQPCCSLTEQEKDAREDWFRDELQPDLREIQLEDDSLLFLFSGDTDREESILELIQREQECCPFLEFTLHWEPDGGPIELRFEHDQMKEIVEEEGDIYRFKDR